MDKSETENKNDTAYQCKPLIAGYVLSRRPPSERSMVKENYRVKISKGGTST